MADPKNYASPDWGGAERPTSEPQTNLTTQAQYVVERIGKLHSELERLNERLHGPRPSPVKNAMTTGTSGEPALRLSLERASGLLSDCEKELAEAMQRL